MFVSVIAQLGIQTTSFAAILAAAGLAIGLALQGSLANFAGGILIMLFKPFKIGDLIEAQGELGVVKEIEIFTTKIIGLSNREIIIPNGALSSALSYYDSMRSETLPANLLQGQRDFFGSHTFERIDKADGKQYHVQWSSVERTTIVIE